MSLVIFLFLQSIVKAQLVSFKITSETVPSSLSPGSNGNLILTFSNFGTTPARNMRLTFQQNPNIIPQQTFLNLQDVNAGSTIQVVVPLSVPTSASQQTTALFYNLDYQEGDSFNTKTFQNYASISIATRGVINILNVSYSRDIISRGNNVDMTIRFENVGGGKVKDLTVSMQNSSLPFVPIGSGTEIFFGDLGSFDPNSVTFKFTVNLDAETRAYDVPIAFSYFDDAGIQHVDAKLVGLKVSGSPEFIVSVDKVENLYAGKIAKITLSVANRGTASAHFLTTFFNTTDLSFLPGQSYVGNLDPDDTTTVTYEVNLAGKGVGNYQLPLVLSYKDPYNQDLLQTKTIQLQVTNQPLEIPSSLIFLSIIVVLGILYWKRDSILRRKKR